MFIHMQMAKEKQNLLLVTFEKKIDKARFECYLLSSELLNNDNNNNNNIWFIGAFVFIAIEYVKVMNFSQAHLIDSLQESISCTCTLLYWKFWAPD